MHLADTLRSILRRWYVFVLGTVLSLGLGWAVYNAVPVTHEASGSVLLIPSVATVGETGNPYLYLGGMTNAVDVLIRRAEAEEVREDIMASFDGAEYVIDRDLATDSPIAIITASAADPENALGLRDAALVSVGRTLDEMQDDLDIAADLRIELRHLVVDSEASAKNKTALQLAAVAVGAGLVGTFMLTGFLDGLLTRRSRRQALRAPGGEGGAGHADVEEPSSVPPGAAVPLTAPEARATLAPSNNGPHVRSERGHRSAQASPDQTPRANLASTR